MTLTLIAERLAVELTIPVFRTIAAGIRTPNLLLAGQRFNPLNHRRGKR